MWVINKKQWTGHRHASPAIFYLKKTIAYHDLEPDSFYCTCKHEMLNRPLVHSYGNGIQFKRKWSISHCPSISKGQINTHLKSGRFPSSPYTNRNGKCSYKYVEKLNFTLWVVLVLFVYVSHFLFEIEELRDASRISTIKPAKPSWQLRASRHTMRVPLKKSYLRNVSNLFHLHKRRNSSFYEVLWKVIRSALRLTVSISSYQPGCSLSR